MSIELNRINLIKRFENIFKQTNSEARVSTEKDSLIIDVLRKDWIERYTMLGMAEMIGYTQIDILNKDYLGNIRNQFIKMQDEFGTETLWMFKQAEITTINIKIGEMDFLERKLKTV